MAILFTHILIYRFISYNMTIYRNYFKLEETCARLFIDYMPNDICKVVEKGQVSGDLY